MLSGHTATWSDRELEASVDAYFEMLGMEINSTPYKKSEISQIYLKGALSKRSRGSFEFRMLGISGILESLSQPRIKSYRPIKNTATEITLKLEKIITEKLSRTPQNQYESLHTAINTLSKSLSSAPPDAIDLISTIAKKILERPEHQKVFQHINSATDFEISAISSAINDFGISDIANIAKNSKARLNTLDQLDLLSKTPTTTEATMHNYLEKNLWIFGHNYTLFSSNKTLKKQIEEYLCTRYDGTSPKSRPDLLLSENLDGEYLIIEFKRPAHALNLNDYLQAISYRHMLGRQLNSEIKILIVGGRRAPSFPIDNREQGVNIMLFGEIISSARRQLIWQLQQK